MKEYIKTIIAIISLIIADLTNNVIGKFIKVANSTYNIKPFWFSVIGSIVVIAIFIELSVKVNSKSKIALIVEFIINIKNSIFRNSLIFQGLTPVFHSNLICLPLFLPLRAETRATFYYPPTTLSSSLAEVRFASLVE